MSRPVLHDYFRSSAAYRVRIALNLKGVAYESRVVNLLEGEQKGSAYRSLNPQGLVPALEIDGKLLSQSLAIIDYLDARFPEPALVPEDPADRAHVLEMALIVACDIHPLNNLRVLKYLSGSLQIDAQERDNWYAHWIDEGLGALEKLAAPAAGKFLFGDTPTLADICLVPQLFNARRFDIALAHYPKLLRAESSANILEAFSTAHPDQQKQAGS